jgi:serine/threonine protein phosphatase 1
MVNRLIAVGDCHGCYNELKDLIERIIKFNPRKDKLIFLGDYIDRGADSLRVILYLQALKARFPEAIILLKGNHEDLAYDALSKGDPTKPFTYKLWTKNGGTDTLKSFKTWELAKQVLLPFIEKLPVSYETDTHIFIHGGIPYGKTLDTATPDELMWDRCGWWFGEKTLVVGHTPKMGVTKIGNIIYTDTACVFGGSLSAIEVSTGEVFSTKPHDLMDISMDWLSEVPDAQLSLMLKADIWRVEIGGNPLEINDFRQPSQ